MEREAQGEPRMVREIVCANDESDDDLLCGIDVPRTKRSRAEGGVFRSNCKVPDRSTRIDGNDAVHGGTGTHRTISPRSQRDDVAIDYLLVKGLEVAVPSGVVMVPVTAVAGTEVVI